MFRKKWSVKNAFCGEEIISLYFCLKIVNKNISDKYSKRKVIEK